MALADTELNATLAALQQTVAALHARVAALEAAIHDVGRAGSPNPPSPTTPPPPDTTPSPTPTVSDDLDAGIVLAIAAAVAAYLGERAHVRQIRLITSQAWGQQGRVTVQASHTLHR